MCPFRSGLPKVSGKSTLRTGVQLYDSIQLGVGTHAVVFLVGDRSDLVVVRVLPANDILNI